jgi:hypothetical protein
LIVPELSNFVIIVWAEQRNSHVETAREQLERLQWYVDVSRGTFLVISLQFSQSLAFDITQEMWNTHKIMNIFITVPVSRQGLPKNHLRLY